jgi:hypothetical protein
MELTGELAVAGAATMPTADGVTTPGDEVVYGEAAAGELAKRRWSASGAWRRGLTRGGGYLRLGNGRGRPWPHKLREL